MNGPTKGDSMLPLGLVLCDDVRADDREHVRRIVESTGFFTPAEVDVAVELVDERLSKGAASGYWFVFAEREGRRIAYACYGPIACTLSSFDLFWIAVEQSSQGQGVGRILLDAAEQRMCELGGTRLYVETSDRAAYAATRAFYEASGYRREATLPDFYASGDHKVIYVKAFDVESSS